jgi:hypothetical protein
MAFIELYIKKKGRHDQGPVWDTCRSDQKIKQLLPEFDL